MVEKIEEPTRSIDGVKLHERIKKSDLRFPYRPIVSKTISYFFVSFIRDGNMPSLRTTVTRKTLGERVNMNFDSLHWSAFRDDVDDE